MKSFIQSIFITVLFSSISTFAFAQTVQDTLVVEGICDMCKERIEEAAYGKGVKFVSWDKLTKKMAIAYNSKKTTLEIVEKRIVDAGHTTSNSKAAREDYESLPDCCRYETLHTH